MFTTMKILAVSSTEFMAAFWNDFTYLSGTIESIVQLLKPCNKVVIPAAVETKLH